MSNLPPSVSINDSDAPWNQDHPEPDWQCTECDRCGLLREVDAGDGQIPDCPNCGSEIRDY